MYQIKLRPMRLTTKSVIKKAINDVDILIPFITGIRQNPDSQAFNIQKYKAEKPICNHYTGLAVKAV